jgi:hypothetical protein
MTGDMQMIDEFTMLWINRLVMMPIMMDMNRCGRNKEDEKKTIIHLIHRDVSDDMKMMKKDIDERREDCRRFTSTTCLKHCSFISYLHPVYIEGLMTGKVIDNAKI